MKSLQKALSVLEYVAMRDGDPVTPSTVAAATGLNLATCTRILADWVAAGYVDKVSRHAGYLPGPMIPALAARESMYTRLARAALPQLREFSKCIDSRPVNIAVMNHDARIMLAIGCLLPHWHSWRHLRFTHDTIAVPSGQLLLSTLEKRDAAKLIKAAGGEKSGLLEQLPTLRAQGRVEFHHPSEALILQGILLDIPGCPPAAIGWGFRDDYDPATIMNAAVQAAALIRKEFTPSFNAY